MSKKKDSSDFEYIFSNNGNRRSKEKRKVGFVASKIYTVIITVLATVVIMSTFIYFRVIKSDDSSSAIAKAMKSEMASEKLKTIKDKINESFYGNNINETNLEEYSILGYVAGLNDEYSTYIPKSYMTEYSEQSLGHFVGIGIYYKLDSTNNAIVVDSTMKGSPAEKAGIKSGDLIVGVNGKKVDGNDYSTLADKIKGKSGTAVKVTILRSGESIDFDLKREQVNVPVTSSKIIENAVDGQNEKIGYIKLNSFDSTTCAIQFKKDYNSLVEQGATKLVIDLRDNGGGILDEALKIGDMFCDKGQTLFIQKDKNGKEEIKKDEIDKEISMDVAVLTNKNSASGSEVLTGILKDNVSNSIIVGTKTYGKGVVQTVFEFNDGSGLKLTTNEYFTPNHSTINKIGIEPTYEINNTYAANAETKDDGTLLYAIKLLETDKSQRNTVDVSKYNISQESTTK